MSNSDVAKPTLAFFRETPADLLSHPPLASSLQHLETSFLLITLRRYPHALVSCASAIESALKAAFKGHQRRTNFESLLSLALERCSDGGPVARADLDEFRKRRNEITHYGFSPKDDEICAILLLKTGYPFIAFCYESLFHFSLKRKGEVYGGLLPYIDHQLDVATRVYSQAKDLNNVNLTYCFISFAHEVRWGIQHWMLSDWQSQILDAEASGGNCSWDYKEKQKNDLAFKHFDPAWTFDCPICNDVDCLVCEMDDGELEKGHVTFGRGFCVNCGLAIPKGCPFLVDELCADQIVAVRDRILKEYGIA